jgi:outer membrane immunogenic protein
MNLFTKAVLSAFALGALFSGVARGADLPSKQPAVAPPPVFVGMNWTGFYVGAHIGFASHESKWTNTNPPGAGTNDANVDASGILGGLQVGYNYQIGQIVIGVEGDGSLAALTQTQSGCYQAFPAFAPQSCKVDSDATATLAGRLGFAFDRALIYLKGGAAWQQFKYVNGCPACLSPQYTESNSRTGWTVGTGLEFALTQNWSVKAEYNYFDFGKSTVTFKGIPGDTFLQDIRGSTHVVKLGLNYLFAFSPTPVVAKY